MYSSLGIILLVILKEWIKKFIVVKLIKINNYTILNIKNDIKECLIKRDRKILIIIDDIDRLERNEVRQLFRIIKANADFPNTIYLLAYDQKIIERIIKENGINSEDFIKKIVQIPFNIPFMKREKLIQILLDELNKNIKELPNSFDKVFDKNHWMGIFHSGFTDFFENIRDIKRFLNSYSFNLSLLFQEETIEVNPIDLMVLEVIRIFFPDFFNFMSENKVLFVSTSKDDFQWKSRQFGDNAQKERINKLEKNINKIDKKYRDSFKEMLIKLFPQLSGLLTNSHEMIDEQKWLKYLRICSDACFDIYFTLYPGGDEKGITQNEIEELKNISGDLDRFRNKIYEYIENYKINTVINDSVD
ncbi:MAG: hypothetical protein K8S23_12380 [Candidatus Cloacimonetes bacterium]|nr:hypothetical protein [Candidatus Cloacimonadota bacterium]